LNGLLNVLKAPGMTSHDVVDVVRRLLGERRVGHTGTLDPAVPGVLPVCVGQATRLSEFLLVLDKSYRAELTLGASSDTLDWTGDVTPQSDASHVSAGDLAACLERFCGTIGQVPPMVSAVRRGGRRLYEIARRGGTVPREPRPVTIHRLELVAFRPGAAARAVIDVRCSKGTYVRSLCAGIGDALGCGGYMSFLVRTGVGPFRLNDALALDDLEALRGEGRLAAALMPPRAVLGHLPAVTVPAHLERSILSGVQPGPSLPVPAGAAAGSAVLLLDGQGEVLAVAVVAGAGPGAGLRLRKVFSGAAADRGG
jgi:tRNA pseudouridine55 synthase